MNSRVLHIFSCYTNFKLQITIISILPGKNDKSLCTLCNFLGYLTSTSKMYAFLSFSL